jgi:hypothetical protein
MTFAYLMPLLLAADPQAGTAAPAFVLHSTRDDLPAGPLIRLTADGTTQVGTGLAVPGPDVVALRRMAGSPPHFPHDRPNVLFANGDRLPGRVLAIANDKLRFLADLGTPNELTVPLSALTAAWITDSAAIRASTIAGRRFLAEKRRQDVVLLANGDTVRGTIVGWPNDDSLALESDGKRAEIPRDRVQALLLNSELARGPKPRGAYRQLVLVNGARLSVRTAEFAGEDLRATTLTGEAVRVPVAALAAVNVFRGPAVYLSDLTPHQYDHTPYLDTRWPVANDRSVAGMDLRLAGGTFDKGLGLHSQCRVSYTLPSGARRFEAVIGLDEQTGRAGSVRIQVLADGKPIVGPAEQTSLDPPRPLRLAIPPSARELSLVVEFGRGGDVQDHVNWADARVIVGKSPGK